MPLRLCTATPAGRLPRPPRGGAAPTTTRGHSHHHRRAPALRTAATLTEHDNPATKEVGQSSVRGGGPSCPRRGILSAAGVVMSSAFLDVSVARALTLADVTPPVASASELTSSEKSVIDIFERNTTSVVNVFDISLIGRAPQAVDAETPEGNGTGFVWDKEGHIVTNYHVLGNILKGLGERAIGQRVAKISLLGSDGLQQSYDAVLVGTDQRKDLAVVKVNAPEASLVPVVPGDSRQLRVGQLCLAIGNPFGFDHTLTTGTISGLGRQIQSQAGSVIGGGIQTDAAINPGNSGGPLLNSKGEVIGVNTAIFTNSGTSAGVGFAIPVETVSRAVPQIIKYGKVSQPSLKIQVATERVAQALQVNSGAVIQSIEPRSNAEAAGLLATRRTLSGVVAGDIIIAVNKRPVRTAGDLGIAVDEYAVGDRVDLHVERDNAELVVPVVLEAA